MARKILNMTLSCGNITADSFITAVFWKHTGKKSAGRSLRWPKSTGRSQPSAWRKPWAILNHQPCDPDLSAEISKLSARRRELLTSAGYPEDYLELSYDCPLCHDTGYIGNEKCTCFKRAVIELLYTQSNLAEILKTENFSHFSFSYYSDQLKNPSHRTDSPGNSSKRCCCCPKVHSDLRYFFLQPVFLRGHGSGRNLSLPLYRQRTD